MENEALQGLDFFSKNPRYITDEAKEKLIKLTAELGDISGIVIDINSKQFIGGNQRSDILDLKGHIENVEWVKEYDTPTKQGTLKVGFFTDARTGEEFNVRLVDWTPEQCDIANLAANYAGGETDLTKLMSNFDSKTVLATINESKFRTMVQSLEDKVALIGFLSESKVEEELAPPADASYYDSFFTDVEPNKESPPQGFFQQIILEYSGEDYRKMMEYFNNRKGKSKEEIVFESLGL